MEIDKIILMYHCVYKKNLKESGFQSNGAYIYKLQAEAFEEQVKSIAGKCRNVIFTFDDGGISFYDTIAPILEKYNLRGIFFIATKFIGTDGFMNKEQIRELYQRGHIIGAHSHTHSVMSELSLEQINFEWNTSVSILSDIIGAPIVYASIPNGYSSKDVLISAKENGVRFLYTSEPTLGKKNFQGMTVFGRFAIQQIMTKDYVLRIIDDSFFRKRIYLKYSFKELVKFLLGKQYRKIKNWILKK